MDFLCRLDVAHDLLPSGLKIYHIKCIFITPASNEIEALGIKNVSLLSNDQFGIIF